MTHTAVQSAEAVITTRRLFNHCYEYNMCYIVTYFDYEVNNLTFQYLLTSLPETLYSIVYQISYSTDNS